MNITYEKIATDQGVVGGQAQSVDKGEGVPPKSYHASPLRGQISLWESMKIAKMEVPDLTQNLKVIL